MIIKPTRVSSGEMLGKSPGADFAKDQFIVRVDGLFVSLLTQRNKAQCCERVCKGALNSWKEIVLGSYMWYHMGRSSTIFSIWRGCYGKTKEKRYISEYMY